MRGLLRPLVASVSFLFAAALVGCGGGGGGGTSAAPPTNPITPVPATATPSPTPAPTSASSTVTVGSSATAAPLPPFGGFSGTISFPAASSGSGSLTLTSALTPPAGAPTLSSALRHPLAVGTTTSLLYLAIGSASAVNFGSTFGFTIVLPSAASSTTGYYLAVYSSSSASAGYQPALGPATVSGSTLTFASASNPVQFAAGQTYVFALYTGALATPTPSPTPTPSASPSPSPSPTQAGPTATPSPSPTPTKSPTPAPTAAPNVGYLNANSSTNVSGVINGSSVSAGTVIGISGAQIAGSTLGGSVGSASVSVTIGATSTSSVARFASAYVPLAAMLPPPEPRYVGAQSYPADGPEFNAMVRQKLRAAPAGSVATAVRRTKALPTNQGATASVYVAVFSIGQSATTYTPVPATLSAVTPNGYIWIDNTLLPGGGGSVNLTAAQVAQIGTDFENAYASDTAHFASPNYQSTSPGLVQLFNTCDSSGNQLAATSPLYIQPTDPRTVVMVVNSNGLGNGVGGYFANINYVPQSIANCLGTQGQPSTIPKSNEAPMIVVGYNSGNPVNFELTQDLVRGTAHEFQHLINFVNHVILIAGGKNEDQWINEGLSVLAQDLAVPRLNGGTNDVDDAISFRAQFYLAAPQNYSISGFIGQDSGSSLSYNCGKGCYGAEYLFQRYLYDRFGGDTYSKGMETSGKTSSANLLANASGGGTVSSLLGDFAIALQNSNTGNSSDPRFNFTGINLRKTYSDPLFSINAPLTGPAPIQQIVPGNTVTFNRYIGSNFYLQVSPLSAAGESVTINDVTGSYQLNGGIWQK